MAVFIFCSKNIKPVNDLNAIVPHAMKRIVDILLTQKFIQPVERIIIADQKNSFDIVRNGRPSIRRIGVIIHCILT
jgi:hypothetical protein